MADRDVVLHLTEDELALLQGGVLKMESALKRERTSLENMKLHAAVPPVDAALKLVQGEDGRPGLKDRLGIIDEEEGDPSQLDWTKDGPDYRTHERNTDGVRELVAAVIDAAPSHAAAVQALNRLEDGEKERDKSQGGPRKSVLDVITAARRPLAKKVKAVPADEEESGEEETVQ